MLIRSVAQFSLTEGRNSSPCGLNQVLLICSEKSTTTGRPKGNRAVAIRGRLGRRLTFRQLTTRYAAKIMLLAATKALVKYVVRIVRNNLNFKRFRRVVAHKLDADCKVKRPQRCEQLFDRFPTERRVHSVWFTDEKTFTVATPVNSQNDRVHARTTRRSDVPAGRLIRECQHFSRKVMVLVGVSRMGKANVIFIDPGAKVDSSYYCEVVL